MQLHGIHHLTAVSADARGNHDFYTRILGMRMVKKTVNQDDVSAYHLFYADGQASPGTDITFFDWPTPREVRGTNSVVRTALRVNGRAALDYWVARLDEHKVPHGPVREVEKSLVLEVAFDSIHASKRHKSGLAMRFPRISRIRRDKPAEEADRIATLQGMVT